jgi:hypothetical protein
MTEQDGNTKGDDKISLYADNNDQEYHVIWYGLCGYSSVTLRCENEVDAIDLFNALLKVNEVEPD